MKELIKSCFHPRNLLTIALIMIVTRVLNHSWETLVKVGIFNVVFIVAVYLYIKSKEK